MKSTRKRSSELGVPRSTMRNHMKKDLNVRPYRPAFWNEPSDGDMHRRYESCRALLGTFSNAVSRSKVLFSDECAIYRSARDRNVVLWSKENPNFTQELEHNPPHVMIWAGVTSDYYWTLLFRWTGKCGILFGNVGDVAHTSAQRQRTRRWIGHGSPTSPAPLPWPPRSPDLTTSENSLWGIIKGRVAARRSNNNNEDLRRAVEDAFRTITPKMLQRMSQRTWRRIRLCVQHQGAHTDSLDM
ncbi:hypothetical protein Cfor_02972 [Coptotermes formosanus]|uniref:Tc1-like transposase DDE domain-containing protein n=1 Tax=Coptotermes formosanus TaxID=36987 RepID=A0A6L2PB87_COPFO|nr:hypothetical protein Cfor_02972 [Coptotermes formosanus]